MNDKIDHYLYHRIIPDLLNSQKDSFNNKRPDALEKNFKPIKKLDVRTFLQLVMDTQTEDIDKIVRDYIDTGYSACQIVEQLLCECARELGEKWCSDDSSITEVSIGMVSLHKVLRDLDESLAEELGGAKPDQSILLITLSQDMHLFGAAVLESFFRNSGWHVRVEHNRSASSIVEDITNTDFSIVGISVNQTRHIDLCKNAITKIRQHSKNRDTKIIVGGFPFIIDDELCEQVGADAIAYDATAALHVAESFLRKVA